MDLWLLKRSEPFADQTRCLPYKGNKGEDATKEGQETFLMPLCWQLWRDKTVFGTINGHRVSASES